MTRNSTSINQQLESLYHLIQQGKFQTALEKSQVLLKKAPQNPDLVHLIALAYKGQGDLEMAKRFFDRSLTLNKNQPQVLNNLGNLLQSQQRYAGAEKYYQRALKLHPNFLDARRNLALCLALQDRYGRAIETYESVLSQHPNDVSALAGIADCYRNSQDYDAAERGYLAVLQHNPQHVNALHNLGLTYHLMGRSEQALGFYQRAYSLAPGKPEIVQSFANISFEQGDQTTAIDTLKQAIVQSPAKIALHQRLNEILWELESDEFGDSYRTALAQLPDNVDLRLAYTKQLFRAERIELADAVINDSSQRHSNNAEILALSGQISAELGRYDQTTADFERALDLDFGKEAGQPLVKLYLIGGDFEAAQNLLDRLLKLDAECQMTWALQGTLWRLRGDERYHWLNNYETFVKPYTLPVPEGYSALDEFLEDLETQLLSLHTARNAPLEQTLRNGTQTAARLLHNPTPQIQALKKSLAMVVSQYIDALPSDPSHPLLKRKSREFEFSGSWSVKLKPEGFHVNHVHPQGWLSSSFYVRIPEGMQQYDNSQQGWIKFGESPLSLGAGDVVEKTVEPKAGMVVLFPSYMWHGTNPFQGSPDQFRMTAPFDVVPV